MSKAKESLIDDLKGTLGAVEKPDKFAVIEATADELLLIQLPITIDVKLAKNAGGKNVILVKQKSKKQN